MDLEILYRIEFAIISSLHYIYPALTIGLASLIVANNITQLIHKSKSHRAFNKFWTKVCAIAFILGLISGFITQFQIQNHWPGFAISMRELFHSPLEIIGFVSMFLATVSCILLIFFEKYINEIQNLILSVVLLLAFLGTSLRIIAINSWMQTPSEFTLLPDSSLPIIHLNNPWSILTADSLVERLGHIWSSGIMVGAFIALSWYAFGILQNRKKECCQLGFKTALFLAVFACVGQLGSGHIAASKLEVTQPAKLAAFEGHIDANAPGDMYLLGWVDNETKEVQGLKVPGGLSFLLHQDLQTKVKGINAFPKDEVPQKLNEIFQSYHVMVGIGFFLIGLMGMGIFLLRKNSIFKIPLLLKAFVLAGPLPLFASIAGWFATEIGRQPYLINGVLTRTQAMAGHVERSESMISLVINLFCYSMLCVVFVWSMNKMTRKVLVLH